MTGDDHTGAPGDSLVTLRRRLHPPRVRAAVDAVVIASAALLLTPVVRMAIDSVEQLRRVFG